MRLFMNRKQIFQLIFNSNLTDRPIDKRYIDTESSLNFRQIFRDNSGNEETTVFIC